MIDLETINIGFYFNIDKNILWEKSEDTKGVSYSVNQRRRTDNTMAKGKPE
jgi:hypothetical protein